MLVSLTDQGLTLVSQVSGRFAADVSTMLGRLTAGDRDTLSKLVSRLVVAHSADHGVDLFAHLVDTRTRPGPGGQRP